MNAEYNPTGKGPKYRIIKQLISSHENFNVAIWYRRYRRLSGSKASAMIGQYQRRTRHTMEIHALSGKRPIEVLQFLSALKTMCNHKGIPEGDAVEIVSKYLTGALSANLTRTIRWAPLISAGCPRSRRLCSTWSSLLQPRI